MASATWSMIVTAAERLLLWLPRPGIWQSVLWISGFCYGYCSSEYGSRGCGAASAIATAASSMALGTVERLLLWLPVLTERLSLWLPLPRVWQSVLWSGFNYHHRCNGVASAIPTAVWDRYW